MSDPNEQAAEPSVRRQNRFAQHPKKTLFWVFCFLFTFSLGVTEYLLEKRWPRLPLQRSIRLRERDPFWDRTIIAKKKKFEDTLEEKAYRLRIDENGFIMPSRIHENPDFSLVFLGGSTTECLFVDEELRFPYRAGVLLGQRLDKKINAYNGGRAGNNSLHILNLLLNKVVPLRPDAVIFMENVNDVNAQLFFRNSYWNDNPFRSTLIVRGLQKDRFTRLFEALRDALFPALSEALERIASRFRVGAAVDEFVRERRHARRRRELAGVAPAQINPPVLVRDFASNVIAFVEICRTRGIMPILMTQANRLTESPDEVVKMSIDILESHWGIDYVTYRRLHGLFNETIRKVAREKEVVLIDLDLLVPKEKTYLYDIVHLNAEGSKLVSTIVAEKLAENAEVRTLLEKKDYANAQLLGAK